MKTFIIIFTSNDKCEISKGLIVIKSKKRNEAIKIFNKKLGLIRKVKIIKELNQKTEGVEFLQDVSIL